MLGNFRVQDKNDIASFFFSRLLWMQQIRKSQIHWIWLVIIFLVIFLLFSRIYWPNLSTILKSESWRQWWPNYDWFQHMYIKRILFVEKRLAHFFFKSSNYVSYVFRWFVYHFLLWFFNHYSINALCHDI